MANKIIQNGGFSSVTGLEFQYHLIKNGKEIIDNLLNVKKIQKPDSKWENQSCFLFSIASIDLLNEALQFQKDYKKFLVDVIP